MKNIAFIILLITLLFLTSCNSTTIIVTTTTNTPKQTITLPASTFPSSTPGSSQTPTPPEEATSIAFATLRANICPTTTPEKEQPSPDSFTDARTQREFAGIYSFSEFWSYTILLGCDGSFIERIRTDFSSLIFIEGRYYVDNGEIFVNGLNENKKPFSFTLIPVKWDFRKYLIEKERLNSFCSSIQSPNYIEEHIGEVNSELFFLRRDDSRLEAKGYPILISGKKACP